MKKSENSGNKTTNNLNIEEFVIIKIPKPRKCTKVENIKAVETIFNEFFDNIQNSGLLNSDTLSDIKYLVSDYLSSTPNWALNEYSD